MSCKLRVILLVGVLFRDFSTESFIMDGQHQTLTKPTTTQDPLLHGGLEGFLSMIQEFETLKSQVEHQEEVNRHLAEKVTNLEKLLNQVNKTRMEEVNYLSHSEEIGGEISTLMQTTTMIESEMTNVVNMASLLSMDMMKAQRSIDDVADCHNTFTDRLQNITSLINLAKQTAQNLQSETENLNTTNDEFRNDLQELNFKTDHVLSTANRINEMRCESGKLSFTTVTSNQHDIAKTVHFSKPFTRSPTISYGVVGIDAQRSGYNLKFAMTLTDVTSSGFQLHAQSTYRLDVQWMACLV